MTKRTFSGDNRWQQPTVHGTANLCSACQVTFENGASRSPKWNTACFGHVWYLLKSLTGDDLDFVISTLPWTVRYWWFHDNAEIPAVAYGKMMPTTSAGDCVMPVFQDVTCVRNKMTERLKSKNIRGRDLVYFLPKHFVPTISCPMGCLIFPDNKAEFIGYQHLYASKLRKNYTSFSAKKVTFRHSRGDWPSASTFLKKPTSAGLYISEKGGEQE
jgi:hypothetical protein